MKKLLLFLLIFLQINLTFSYELSKEKNDKIIQLKSKLWLLKYEKNINWYYNIKKLIDKKIPPLSDSEKIFILEEIRNEILYIIDSYKPENYDEIKYDDKEKNQNYKKDFFEKHGQNIINVDKLRDSCIKNFDFVDEIAKRNDFPTALIIATWSKEYNCQLSKPANGYGPFQIISQNYSPGDITLSEFETIVQNYIDFSKGKIKYFNSNKSYKSRFGDDDINLTYDNYTLRDLRLYAILYNGIGKTTNPETSKFANGNLNQDMISDTDGIVTLFLKVLNWQLKNNK